MMNFLDLSAASEEERRLIREILSDTSVVNIAEPQRTSQLVVSNAQSSSLQQQQPEINKPDVNLQQSYQQQHAKQQQGQKSQQSTKDNQQQHSSSSANSVIKVEALQTSSHVNAQQHENSKFAIKSQKSALTPPTPTPINAHQPPTNQQQNGLETVVDSSAETNKVAQISSNVDVPEISAPIVNFHGQQQQQLATNPQIYHQHSHLNGQRHSFKSGPNQQHMSYSNNGHYNINNNPVSGNSASSSSNRNYNSQRKPVHNSNNSNNSIGNNSGSIRNNRLPNLGNVVSSAQQHYPQQYTPPLPSNTSPTAHYHNINNNINTHSANPLNSQSSHQNQRSNEHSNDRLRSSANHINSNNDINIVATSAPGMVTLTPNLDQHHGNAMPLNVYNHHTAMHHQVPPPLMPTAKLDTKSSNLKNQAYHSQDTSASMQNTSSGAQSVPQPPSAGAQMPIAGDMNSVIGMDMTSTQPPGYAIPPPHVTAFGPPPHHVYGGPPIFQPYPTHYIFPYPPYVPYVLPPNSVVPSRQQVSHQTPNTSTSTSSHPRHLTHHQHHQHHQQQSYEHYINMNNNQTTNQQQFSKEIGSKTSDEEIPAVHQSQNLRKNSGENELINNEKSSLATKLSTSNPASPQIDIRSLPQKSEKSKKNINETESDNGTALETKMNPQEQNINESEKSTKISTGSKTSNISRNNSSNIKNKNVVPIMRIDRTEHQVQKVDIDQLTSHPHPTTKALPLNKNIQQENSRDSSKPPQDIRNCSTINVDDKVSINDGFDTQSSSDVSSKQIRESSLSEQSKPTPESCNKSSIDKNLRESNSTQVLSLGTNDIKSNELPQRTGGAWSSASSKSWADLFKRGGVSLLGSSTNGENEHNISGSENSDEENKTLKYASYKSGMNSKINNISSTLKEHRSQEAAKRALDKMAPRLAQKINSINLKHSLPFLRPRGFINKGNGCYINATLQALIACPPFYNLMKEVGDLRCFRRDFSCTPILDSFAEFFLNFPPLDSNKKNKQQSTSQDQKLQINSLQAEAIEPKCIYNVLGQIKSECLKGAQEDAEEFLSSVLNGLHEEMIGLGDALQPQPSQDTGTHNGHPSDVEDSNDDVANDDNLWREVGSKNRSLPIRTAKVINTPIQEIFGGSLFSIRTAGKDRCGHRSPFFDLQLDISGDNVKSVQDAIKSFTATEIIHDFYCSKTKQKVDAQRRTSLDQLPPILILHLKQFVYTQDHGLKKLIKKIEYPIDFELPENCLHEKNSADKNLLTSRSYKLLAVVYHDGKEAIKGHYLTDVYHIGSSQWIRCDDGNLKVISSPRIENPDSSRTPYLLFYRRLNTLRAQIGNNHDNKKKS